MIKIKRLGKSFIYAFRGLFRIYKEEQNLKIQSIFGIIMILLGFYFGINRYEWIALIMASLVVILMEVANSAVERITDVLKPRIHTYVKEIKDIMAAAVMLASMAAIVIGLIIFIPYIFRV